MADFIIEFEALAIKADINELHIVFLLKKNVWSDIIKIILGYLLIATLKILKEWKVAIISVRQGYKSTEERHNYKIGTRTIYSRQELLMDIGKLKDNFKDRKSKCFNCKIYKHITKYC